MPRPANKTDTTSSGGSSEHVAQVSSARRPVSTPKPPNLRIQRAVEAFTKNDEASRQATVLLVQHFRRRARIAARQEQPLPFLLAMARAEVENAVRRTPLELATFTQLVFLIVNAIAQGYEDVQAQEKAESANARSLAVKLVEDDRHRLARELHDEAGQILTSVLFRLDLCLTNPASIAAIQSNLREIRDTLANTASDVRRMVYSLAPPMLQELGLIPTLQWLGRQFSDLYGIAVIVEAPDQCALSEATSATIYRIVQEALTNVARHAHATEVRIRLRLSPRRVVCTVVDNGRGFRVEEVPSRATRGLAGMRERAGQLRGQLVIRSKPNSGTSVRVNIPI